MKGYFTSPRARGEGWGEGAFNTRRHSGMRRLAQATDAQLRIGESILPVVVMDSGFARKGSRPGMMN